MFQDLVIGPDIIDFVHHHGYRPDDVKKNIIGQLDEMLINEIIWFDKEKRLPDLFLEKVMEIGDQIAYNWWDMRFGDIGNKKYNYKYLEKKLENQTPIKGLKKEDQIEGAIVKKKKECIWLKSKNSIKLRIDKIKKITTAVHPISFENYINADVNTGVIKDNQKWDLEEGDVFPFPKIYYPIFKKAKIVEICDPYILHPHFNNGERNLISIIDACRDNCKIRITTLKQSQRTDKTEFSSTEYINIWSTGLMQKYKYKNLKIIFAKNRKSLMERSIKTDIAEIELGHGLQAYRHDNDKTTMQTKPSVKKK